MRLQVVESDAVEEQPNVEEGAIQANSGGVVVQPTQAGLGPDSHNFQEQPNVQESAIQANSWVSFQPKQACLGLESHSSQEQLNVKEGSIGVSFQPTQAGEGRSILANPGVVVQPTQAAIPILEQSATGWIEASHQEPEAGIIDRNVLQALSDLVASDIGDSLDLVHFFMGKPALIEALLQRLQSATGQAEASHQEAAAGIFVSIDNEPALIEELLQSLRNTIDQIETSHQEEEAGINVSMDEIIEELPQILRSATCQFETSHLKEEAGINVSMNELTEELLQSLHSASGQVETSHDEVAYYRNALQVLLPDLRDVGWIELADLEEPIDDEADNGIQAQTDSQQMQNSDKDNAIPDRNWQQAHPSDQNHLRNVRPVLADMEEPSDGDKEIDIQAQTDSQEKQNHEEDNGIQAWIGNQQLQDRPPQQGTAEHTMRLQVPLGASIEGGVSLEQEAGSTCSLNAEGPICTEGLNSCVAEPETESDYPDVAQQTPQDVPGSSSTPSSLSLTSLVNLLLGLLGDACVLPAFAAELPIEMERMNFGSEDGFNGSGCSERELEGRRSMASHLNSTGPYLQERSAPSRSEKEAERIKMQQELAQAVYDDECRKTCMGFGTGFSACLVWIAMLALTLLHLFCRFCRLTRMALNSVL